ncbi:hypothetical protein ACJQ40_001977 [Enterococcus faecium]|nr:hypothetical protein [Enterococcus faecium]
MKKRWVLLASLLMGLLVLGACGSKKEAAASANHDLLKPGTTWKYSSLDDWEKIKVIDETTWEYSEDMNPDPIQISVKRVKDFKGFETYQITDSGGVQTFINEKEKNIIIPFEKDGVKEFALLQRINSNETRDNLQDLAKTSSKYKLQKTGE